MEEDIKFSISISENEETKKIDFELKLVDKNTNKMLAWESEEGEVVKILAKHYVPILENLFVDNKGFFINKEWAVDYHVFLSSKWETMEKIKAMIKLYSTIEKDLVISKDKVSFN
jgi:hypothetical protein